MKDRIPRCCFDCLNRGKRTASLARYKEASFYYGCGEDVCSTYSWVTNPCVLCLSYNCGDFEPEPQTS
jgi:hypothetical protein